MATGRLVPGRLAKIAGLITLVGVTATGCSGSEVLNFGWPDGVSPQADRMRHFWTWSVIAALVVGAIVWGLIIWSVIFHRKRGGRMPKQFQYNHSLEFVYTVIPLVMVAVLFYFTVITQDYVQQQDKNPDVRVNITAFQWNWEFGYPGYRTPEGDAVSTVGSSQEIPLLVLPTSETIAYDLRSTDVIHSFWVPQFNFKRDVFPRPEKNDQIHTFQNTIDRQGSFVGRCAELCGTYHSMMNFEVRALSPKLFDQYMGLRTRNNPQTGEPYTAAEALSKMDCGELCAPQAVTTRPFDTSRTSRKATEAAGS
ncbi:MAG: aa3-type cytochrome oxidase subunit II [Sciscionella sp.]